MSSMEVRIARTGGDGRLSGVVGRSASVNEGFAKAAQAAPLAVEVDFGLLRSFGALALGITDLGRILLLERSRQLAPRSVDDGVEVSCRSRKPSACASRRSLRLHNDTPAGIGSDWGSATSQDSARPTSRIISGLSITPAPDGLFLMIHWRWRWPSSVFSTRHFPVAWGVSISLINNHLSVFEGFVTDLPESGGPAPIRGRVGVRP